MYVTGGEPNFGGWVFYTLFVCGLIYVLFVLIGGMAAMAHGVTLVTFDVDICCPFMPENLFKLQRALTGSNPSGVS